MNNENRTEYSFNASGTIVEWLIVGFSIYGFVVAIKQIVDWIF